MQIDATLTWSTDMSSAPADTRVLLAYTEDGASRVTVSWRVPPAWDRPTEPWFGLTKRAPYAWAPWPEAPEVE